VQILGRNQLSLAKYLFIAAQEDNHQLHTHDIRAFMIHVLERMDFSRDLHFHTNTTIDTLDYSGDGLNSGSKVVFAAAGEKKRELWKEIPAYFEVPSLFGGFKLTIPGVVALEGMPYSSAEATQKEIALLNVQLKGVELDGLALIILCDDAEFTAADINNLVWVTFTRSNPSHDVHGINSFPMAKSRGCTPAASTAFAS